MLIILKVSDFWGYTLKIFNFFNSNFCVFLYMICSYTCVWHS